MREVVEAIERLDSWVERNGWRGWDPYDVRNTLLFMRIEELQPLLVKKIIRKLLYKTVQLFPLYMRKILHVEPRINAKGMGLFLRGYTNCYQATSDQKYLDKAYECSQWLIKNRSRSYTGHSWGYPFDWKSPILFPEGTPSSVVTAAVGDGFYSFYKCTGDDEYLRICEDICLFFQNELKVTYASEDKNALCFSYTPLDDYQVHNANLFVGEFFTRIGKETRNNNLVKMGVQCGNFALSEQQDEGYLPYWGLSQTQKYSGGRLVTDHYHSGFEIRMLFQMWKNTQDIRFQKAYKKYYNWYLENLFENSFIPKYTRNKLYPINIHSCSEAILCGVTLLCDNPTKRKNFERTVNWVIEKMEYRPGEYAYLIDYLGGIGEWKVKIPMIRWGQAWMLRALSEVLLADFKSKSGFSNN